MTIRKLLLAAAAWLGCMPAFAQQDVPVQAQMVRTMIVTCKIEESIKFYRDVLGETVQFDGFAPASLVEYFADVPKGTKIRFIIMEGKGEYPAGPIIGSRVGFLGIPDPKSASCKNMNDPDHRRMHGEIIMPTRVSNTAEIVKRAKAMGIKIAHGPGPSPSSLTTQTLLWDPNGVMLELFELNVTKLPPQ